MTYTVIPVTELQRLQRAEQASQAWRFFAGLMSVCCLALGVLTCVVGESHDRMAERIVQQNMSMPR